MTDLMEEYLMTVSSSDKIAAASPQRTLITDIHTFETIVEIIRALGHTC
jgi:hypothetical protein